MSNLIFFPPPIYTPKLQLLNPMSVEDLCKMAGVTCRASGSWTQRQIEVGNAKKLIVNAEPGDHGAVRILSPRASKTEKARIALIVLAYGLGDLVAKASIVGLDWTRISAPRGRPPTGKALTSTERQRLFRKRHAS